MKWVKLIALLSAVAFLGAGCMTIISLEQPYEGKANKDFTTTLELLTPDSDSGDGEDQPDETFSYGILAFSLPIGWEVSNVKTVEGDITPKWARVPANDVDPVVGYSGEGDYPWMVFVTNESYSNITDGGKKATIEIKIKPNNKGKYELGYASGSIEVDSFTSVPFSPSFGENEVNGGDVIFKRIWIK